MNMRNSLTKFAFKYFLWFVKFWYGLSMFLTRDRKTKVAEYTTYQEVVDAIGSGSKWRPDPIKGMLDVTTHPTRFQQRLNRNKEEVEDCDGHAAYWCVSLLKSGLASKAWFCFFQMKKRTTGKQTGHALCVFEDFQGRLKWCDYLLPSNLDPKDDWSWATQSANVFNADAIAAGMIEVELDKKTDSIKFKKTLNKTKF